jgi:diguanylate cyclase (GGDEF)-like protein/PAS domain S-box-containing protein
MLALIAQRLAPPTFAGDEKKTFRARFLNVMLISGILVVGLTVVGNLLDSRTPLRNFLIDFCIIGLFAFLRHQLFAGRVQLVAYVSVIAVFAFQTFAMASEGTTLVPTTALFSLFVIVAGFFFNLWGIVVAIMTSSLIVAGIILARHAGILPSPNLTESTLQWFIFTITFGVTGGLTYFSQHQTQEALTLAENEIRDRERAETELRKLSQAVEQSPVSIVITDLDGTIEYVNPRFIQLTGYRSEETIGENPRILKTDLTPPETYQQLWETITQGKEWHGEFANRKKDGSLYYEAATISPIINPNGITTHYLAVKEDITERKQAADRLKTANEQLQLHVTEVEKLQQELSVQAIRDPLTGLYNRRFLAESMGRETARAARGIRPLSVLILDIDHFKSINDTFGHKSGDEVLLQLGALLAATVREEDIVCRYGGDEFVVVMVDASEEDVRMRAEMIRRSISEMRFQFDKIELSVTSSIGIAAVLQHGDTWERAFERADAAMYRAKKDGRNRVVVVDPGAE